MKYENRIVLFLDILGFQNHVNRTIGGNSRKCAIEINKLYKTLLAINDFEDLENKIKGVGTQFSDTLAFSFKIKGENQFGSLLDSILDLIVNLAGKGVICRGGISHGKLIHTKDIIFGPALIDAYLSESKAALYPRVILDQKTIRTGRLRTYYLNKNSSWQEDKKSIPLGLAKDEDGKYFIDYISCSHIAFTFPNDLVRYIKKLRRIIVAGLRFKNPDLKVKYGWMQNKFNKMLDQYSTDKFISGYDNYYQMGRNPQADILEIKKIKKI